MTRKLWTLLILLALIFGLAWTWLSRVPAGSGAAPSSRPAAPVIGYPAPDFALMTLAGEEFRLSAQRDMPVVLNFWATWCPPCRAELPELKVASEQYAGQVAIVGVNQAEATSAVAQLASDLGLRFPIPLDQSGTASQNGPLTEATLAQLLQTIYP
jgi:thiol-disulfide isomerase/thioredoxin